MEHFKAEGPLFRSVGAAGAGSMRRRIVLISMTVFAFLFTAVIVFLLTATEGSGTDAKVAIYPMAVVFILCFAFSILTISRMLGGGGLTVDTSTGEVSFRNASSFGFRSTKIYRSDIHELSLVSYSYNQGRNTSYRVMFHTASGNFVPAVFSFNDLDTAREAGGELASLLSVALLEKV